MKRKGFLKSVTVFVMCILFGFSAKCEYFDGTEGKQSRVIESGVGEYALVDNNAKFDGTVYEYKLDSFFSDDKDAFYTYTITSGKPEDGSIDIVKENILRIAPGKELLTEIEITATDSHENTFRTRLKLKYVNAVGYVTDTVLSVTLKMLGIFLLFLLFTNVLVPFGGNVRIKKLNSDLSTTKKPAVGSVEISHDYPVRGRICGGWGKYVKFLPKGDAYVKNGETAERVSALRIDCGSAVDLYADIDCREGINVHFYK